MDQGGGVLELHTQELKIPHAMLMQDFGTWLYVDVSENQYAINGTFSTQYVLKLNKLS